MEARPLKLEAGGCGMEEANWSACEGAAAAQLAPLSQLLAPQAPPVPPAPALAPQAPPESDLGTNSGASVFHSQGSRPPNAENAPLLPAAGL